MSETGPILEQKIESYCKDYKKGHPPTDAIRQKIRNLFIDLVREVHPDNVLPSATGEDVEKAKKKATALFRRLKECKDEYEELFRH